ncbi:hypothetical protein F4804DRAFT_64183 [Jackrogersella minutella]|nr:hypothetical protein F4804DRAFT_64183 [Jackrogersella minutella]
MEPLEMPAWAKRRRARIRSHPRSHPRRIPPNRPPRRARSLPSPICKATPPPPPTASLFLPALDISLPYSWHHWKPPVVRCPVVPRPPRWLPSPGLSSRSTDLKLCDIRSLDNRFPFPLRDYKPGEIDLLPDHILAQIITDWRRTPVLSIRPDTRNVVSRISPNLVAKWGPKVCQGEADIMWIAEGRWGMRNHIPRVRKVIRDDITGYRIIIMDYVDGINLADLWGCLSSKHQHIVAVDIAKLVRTMQNNSARYPGPPGITPIRALVHKNFPIPLCLIGSEYDRYINILLDIVNRDRSDDRRIIGSVLSRKFVLSNMKLDPSSFIIDRKSGVWIVGWGKGGFYPPEAELGIAEHLMPSNFYEVLSELLRLSHDPWTREVFRSISDFIDGNTL